MFFATLQAQPQQSMLPTLLMFGGMGLLFYFLLIRPQSKARKAMQERLSKLKAGDEVLLAGGLYGVIDRVEDQCVYLKLGSAIVKARKSAVVAFANEPVPEQN